MEIYAFWYFLGKGQEDFRKLRVSWQLEYCKVTD